MATEKWISKSMQQRRAEAAAAAAASNTTVVVCGDAVAWLEAQEDGSLPSVCLSIPDMAELTGELRKDADAYKAWYKAVARLTFQKTSPGCVVCLFATDRFIRATASRSSHRISKPALACAAADLEGWLLGSLSLGLMEKPQRGRPQFSSLLIFCKGAKIWRPAEMFHIGAASKSWPNATPTEVVDMCMSVVEGAQSSADAAGVETPCGIVDLFAGVGTIAAEALHRGLQGTLTCVELDEDKCCTIRERLAVK